MAKLGFDHILAYDESIVSNDIISKCTEDMIPAEDMGKAEILTEKHLVPNYTFSTYLFGDSSDDDGEDAPEHCGVDFGL